MKDDKRKIFGSTGVWFKALLCTAAFVPGFAQAQNNGASGTASAQSGTPMAVPVVRDAVAETSEPEAGRVADIIVTAQRRHENLQNVPLSVTVESGEKLATSGITSSLDLGTVTPGLSIGQIAGFSLPHVRGVGTTSHGATLENSVATYVDDVYYASAYSSIFSLSNIAQVEVLKGPQGTLFGRNATGGVILVTTRDPKPGLSGNAELGYGNYQTVSGNFYVTGGNDVVSADLSFYGAHSGNGYGTNLFNGQDVYKADKDIAVRSKWLFNLGENTKARLIFDYSTVSGSQFSAVNSAPGTVGVLVPLATRHSYDVNDDFQPYNNNKSGGVSLRVDQDLVSVKLVSVTAYRRSYLQLGFDLDFSPIPFASITQVVDRERQFSQEFQLQSGNSSKLKWVAGLYYFNSRGRYDPSQVAFAPFVMPPVSQVSTYSTGDTQSVAGFGQASLEVLPATNITVGARYTYERRTLDASQIGTAADGSSLGNLIPPIVNARKTAKKPTFRVAVDHRFSSEALVYASFNTGFKSGGFNAGVPIAPPFNPETLTAYEAGLKLDLLDRRLRLNSSAFYYDYKNIQVEQPIIGQVYYLNGASARLYGLDLDLTAAVSDRLTITGGVELLHSSFTSFPNAIINTQSPTGGVVTSIGSAKGNALPYAPSRTASVTAQYRLPILGDPVDVNVTYSYNSGYVFQADNILKQKQFSVINATLNWKIGMSPFAIRLYAKNITNKIVSAAQSPSGLNTLDQLNPPRTYGGTVSVRF